MQGPTARGGRGAADVRALVPDDLDGVGALFAAHTGRPADLGLIGAWLGDAPAAAADEAGLVVGFALCRRFAPDVAEVANLLVGPAHRGCGLGAALLDAVEEAAFDAGYRAMIVVRSSLYRTGASSSVAPDPSGAAETGTRLYAHRGYRDVLSTGPTVVAVKGLGAG